LTIQKCIPRPVTNRPDCRGGKWPGIQKGGIAMFYFFLYDLMGCTRGGVQHSMGSVNEGTFELFFQPIFINWMKTRREILSRKFTL
jgi:hypothetical protein